jgi:hypothetical protein
VPKVRCHGARSYGSGLFSSQRIRPFAAFTAFRAACSSRPCSALETWPLSNASLKWFSNSTSEALAIRTNFAKSPCFQRPNPSAMFHGPERPASTSCPRRRSSRSKLARRHTADAALLNSYARCQVPIPSNLCHPMHRRRASGTPWVSCQQIRGSWLASLPSAKPCPQFLHRL